MVANDEHAKNLWGLKYIFQMKFLASMGFWILGK